MGGGGGGGDGFSMASASAAAAAAAVALPTVATADVEDNIFWRRLQKIDGHIDGGEWRRP